MASYAWVLEVRPGYEELYKLRHDALWPEMLAELHAAGFTTTTWNEHDFPYSFKRSRRALTSPDSSLGDRIRNRICLRQ
jgi:hypothetical protein